jgi:carbonic anhydrase/acetyltransferase-like protein (isoleucine patch superfamily)
VRRISAISWHDGHSLLPLQVEPGAIVAAGAMVPPGKRVPAGQVWAGVPARYLRDVEQEERSFVEASATNYAQLADMHRCEWMLLVRRMAE